jgi:hypothetical protein
VCHIAPMQQVKLAYGFRRVDTKDDCHPFSSETEADLHMSAIIVSYRMPFCNVSRVSCPFNLKKKRRIGVLKKRDKERIQCTVH